jgi:ATP-dependent DNA helicase RecG
MAPTEILAEQHYNTLRDQLEDLPVNITLIVGAQKKKEREHALDEVSSGFAHIAIGTHALIEEGVYRDRYTCADRRRCTVRKARTCRDR